MAASTSRWRGNNYVLDPSLVRADGRYVGVLPWQRCNASQFHPGPSRLFASFPHEGAAYDLAATALSIWGGADATGKPDRTSPLTAELLVFFGVSGKPCRPLHGIHCGPALTRPRVKCRPVGATEWAEGATVLITEWPPPPVGPLVNRESTGAATLTCPLDAAFALTDSFQLEFVVGDDADDPRSHLLVDACYEHVDAPVIAVVCTEPLYGFNLSSPFWVGSVGGKPRYPFNSTLLDAFIVYHTRVHGERVVISDYHSEVAAYITERYGHRHDVAYRSQWVIDDRVVWHGSTIYKHEMEVFQEATCWWENRIRAHWFQIIHSVDGYIFPTTLGEHISDVLGRLDPRKVSELAVPMLQGHSPILPGADSSSEVHLPVLQRFSFLGPELQWLDVHFTPIGNPRHFTFGMVHWLQFGMRPEARATVHPIEVRLEHGLQTMHLTCLSRPNEDLHEGTSSPQWDLLGAELSAALAAQERELKSREMGEAVWVAPPLHFGFSSELSLFFFAVSTLLLCVRRSKMKRGCRY